MTALALLASLAAASPASAAKTMNGFVGGQGGVNRAGLFTQPRDVAVYANGTADPSDDKVFVVEGAGANHRIQRLDAHGNVELVWGRDVIGVGAPGDTGTGAEVCDVSVSGLDGCKAGPPGTEAGELDDPMGIAVNPADGSVYVLDRDNRRVQRFTQGGAFVAAWGWGVDTGAAAFEVCTSSCQAGRTGQAEGNANAGQFGTSSTAGTGIAVAASAPHDVFAADPANQRVLRFDADGTLDASPAFGSAAEFSSNQPLRLAVDAAGVVYASDNTGATNRVNRYDTAASAFLPALDAPLLATGTTRGLEVDPASGDLYVARQPGAPANPFVAEVSNPGTPAPSLDATHVFDIENPLNAPAVNGLGYDPANGNLYLPTVALFLPPNGVFDGCEEIATAGTAQCHGLVVLDDDGSPAAGIDPVVDPGATTAQVSGDADAGGGVTRYFFEVSTDGASWQRASATRTLSGDDPIEVGGQLTGLEPNTAYLARLRLSKQVGMDEQDLTDSATTPFTTDPLAPGVVTSGTSKRTPTSARLRGTVDPQNASTTYRFEYRLAGQAITTLQTPDRPAGAGGVPQLFAEDVPGGTPGLDDLTPGTQYEYRIVATNFVGTSSGNWVEFTTPEAPPSVEPIDRAYELVSTEKFGGQGVGDWYKGPGSHALAGFGSYEEDRFAVRGELGVVLTDGAYGYASDWALSERTPAGWASRPAMNRRAYGRQKARMLAMSGANESMSLTTWNSNAGLLRLFEEMREWPDDAALFARDWSGNWEVVGPTDPAQETGGNPFGARVVVDDGSAIAASSRVRGLAGPGDPALNALATYRNVYIDALSPSGLSNTFPGQGTRSVVNVCSDETVIPSRLPSGKLAARPCPPKPADRDASLVDSRGASLGVEGDHAVERAVSEDGSRVFFMAPDPEGAGTGAACAGTDATTVCPTQLYVRQRNPDGSLTTHWIARSEVANQDASLLAPVTFEGASRDGDKVLLRTATPLTEDDPNGVGQVGGGVTTGAPNPLSVDLFLYDFPDDPQANPADGDLLRISGGPDGTGDPNVSTGADPAASGSVRFLSKDASRAYFVSAAPLGGIAQPDDGTITEPGGTPSSVDASNLYLFDANLAGAERWTFIARLPRTSELGRCATRASSAGAALTNNAFAVGLDGGNCLRGTSDASFVTLWTDGALTDSDPDGVSGDIYGYDADADVLTRLSEPLPGAGGDAYQCAPGDPSAVACYADPGYGKAGSPLPPLGVASEPEQSGDRMAFFQSRSQLVPADGDAAFDVYQWRNGELSLVSTGSSAGDGAFYQGGDRTGQTVFFSTTDPLTWDDRDAVMDVYAARGGGGFDPPPPPPGCDPLAGGCQGPGAEEAGTSGDFQGPGDGNAVPRPRVGLALGSLTARARARAARSGVIALPVRLSRPGRVRIVARARIGGRSTRVARRSVAFRRAGRKIVRLRLSRAARRSLARRGALRVSLAASAAGAPTQTARVSLKRKGAGR